MSNVQHILSARTLGDSLPISVGTAMALEAIGEAGVMEVLWINVATLARNLYESVPTDYRGELTPAAAIEACADEIMSEIKIIDEVAASHKLAVTYYILGYKDLARKYPFARIRVPNTDIQKARFNYLNDTIEALMRLDERQRFEFDKNSEIRGEPKRALVISHYPTDLLSRAKFTQLRLLESHTGAVKPKSKWNTKLTDGNLYGNIPFNYWTVQIFGDGANHFDRYPTNVRKAVAELAQVRHWTTVTTIDKIRYSLKNMRDQYAAAQLLKML